ncbi:hypothetical protein IVB18_49655 (plasmid) [Bradyrhizobium sp. 186]|uniref:hypothetical protein n=1 Tax=Bradyrhizobium sp. 186 TaxID=2782654 RepID=UPI0020010522|nr:hypothetical protein [Bradyrhizobium sp. 186]UPK40986.1 hypothetical protein IVB18_49655 [Bradyrhizobium sp. 186]
MASLANFDASNIFAVIGRITPVKPVELSLTLCPGENAGSISMYFEGIAWKLSGIALPPRVIAAMVDRLPAR